MSTMSVTHVRAPFDTALPGLIAQWRAARPECGVLAFVAEADREAIPALQAACAAAGAPLAGAMFPQLIVDGGFRSDGMLLMRFDAMPPAALCPGVAEGDGADRLVAAVSEMLDALPDDEEASLFLLCDGMLPNIASMLDGLYLNFADRVHYMGVNAGSETFQPMPCIFDAHEFAQGAVLALLLPRHPGAILDHGYHAPETLVTATSAENNCIVQIDWRPAFDVYRERMRAEYGVEVTRENFYEHAVHFPFGIMRANGDVLVRIPVALQDNGAIFCVGEIPPNALLTLMRAPDDGGGAMERLGAQLSGAATAAERQPHLVFYCAGRRMHLGAAADAELHRLKEGHAGLNFVGALSLGEIGNTERDAYPLFHNATVVSANLVA